jgi:ferric hydroxamate transport system substrate-binding protein
MRRFLAAILTCISGSALSGVTVTDRDLTTLFDMPPERVVVLDWALAEQVLDLGISPVGAPELGLYEIWVSKPALPETTIDVGLRTEPNLEGIAALNPDVILASDLDPALENALARIAPTVVFKAWNSGHDNVAAAREIFLLLASLFQRTTEAKAKLAEQEIRLTEIAARIAALNVPTQATAIRLNDEASVWIYGTNSFPQHVLERLGLSSEITLAPSRWGVAQRPLAALAEVEEGVLLAIEPHMDGGAAKEGPLWQALPAVARGHYAEVPPVWSYGGILSLERHAEAFLAALERMVE